MTTYIHDMEVDDFLGQSVSVEPLALQEEFVRVSADLAYWGAQYAQATKRYLRAEHERKVSKAKLTLQAPIVLRAKGEKSSDPAIEAWVLTQDDYGTAVLLEIEAEAEKLRLWTVFKAIQAKQEALVSIGATMRKEMEGDPIIRDRARQQREFGGGR